MCLLPYRTTLVDKVKNLSQRLSKQIRTLRLILLILYCGILCPIVPPPSPSNSSSNCN